MRLFKQVIREDIFKLPLERNTIQKSDGTYGTARTDGTDGTDGTEGTDGTDGTDEIDRIVRTDIIVI